jgi:putative membrane protein
VNKKDLLYSRFDPEELIVRDYLAVDRTALANERTLLAYIRTALSFFVVGVSLIQFFSSLTLHSVGWALIIFTPGILTVGIWRFFMFRKQIRNVKAPNKQVGSGL